MKRRSPIKTKATKPDRSEIDGKVYFGISNVRFINGPGKIMFQWRW